ncbi:sensor histidine kinase [Parapedobacter sp. DT-150]|uniref:sensor histidine kinase n=1 Tax=Parapedobacter sp. DT-150 TaxID=3396162 RepID=UPI003F1B55C6
MRVLFKHKHINTILHILIWSLLLLFPYFVSSADTGYQIGYLPGLFLTITGIIHVVIFYGNAFYLYPKLFTRRFWWLYIVAGALLVMFSVRLKFWILITWFPDTLSNQASYKFVFIPSVIIFVISVVYRMVIDKIRSEREQQQRNAAQLSTELKFLRSQISPHFLFNVLTNLVSLARKKSDRLEASLLMLSDLMRYMLYDTQGKIALHKEVEYLNSYIALQRLRFGNEVQVDWNVDCDVEASQHAIEPMLLIPFVENAFKHGAGYADQPHIDIKLLVRGGILTFQIWNKFDNEGASKDKHSGIGLDNVKSRLNLLYEDKHNLSITDHNNRFHVTLILNLL